MTDMDDKFAERISKPLRAPERVDSTFEARAMSAVFAAMRAGEGPSLGNRRNWWLRPRTFRLTPVASLALAAGFAALLVGASLIGTRATPTAQTAAAPADTVHVVRFVLVQPNAERVALVGAFNQWRKDATWLEPAEGASGVWTVEVPLAAGRHEYAFVVYDARGERWVVDPYSQTVRDDYGTESSLVHVGIRRS
jgi:hypothetical protein